MPTTTTADFLEVIAHMRLGSVYRVAGVSWDEYEQLLADLGEGYAARIFYDRGRIEIAAPAFRYERRVKVIHSLLIALGDELDVAIESAGSTTFRKKTEAIGAEPDNSFYIQHAAQIIGKDDLNLAYDPPPDLVVENDRTNSSLDRFPIYAGLDVPEIWRIVERQVRVWLLAGDHYEESEHSLAFPFLSADTLSEFLAKGLEEGEGKAARAFREWVRAHKPANL
jgi:Uma2 family endonuclease